MNQKVLQTLEFDKIINILTGYATTELGKLMCANLKPMTEEADILNAQDQTQDALTRIYKRGNVSFFGVSDLSPSLARLKMRGTLGTGELLDIARVLESVKNAVSYGVRMEDDLEADSLDELFESLVPLDDLLHEIRRCIISEEEISDDASSTLKHIRRAMKQTNQKIHTQLTTLVSSASNQDKLQDAIVTMRNGRYCIPVKQEYRSSFQGMIHDQSASGNTLFIEPMSVVTLNNELKELELQPFQAAINSGVDDAIMVAHIAYPEITGSMVPATLSSLIITDILREDMQFDGVIFTDSIIMKALSTNYTMSEIAVLGVNAGIDVFIAQNKGLELFNAIKTGVETGKIGEETIDSAVKRVLKLKYKYQLFEEKDYRQVDHEANKEIFDKIIVSN